MISWGVAPYSASRAAVALRRSWAEQCGNPASSHHARKRLPNPATVKGLPYCFIRNVSCPAGTPAIASARSGNKRDVNLDGLPVLVLRLDVAQAPSPHVLVAEARRILPTTGGVQAV